MECWVVVTILSLGASEKNVTIFRCGHQIIWLLKKAEQSHGGFYLSGSTNFGSYNQTTNNIIWILAAGSNSEIICRCPVSDDQFLERIWLALVWGFFAFQGLNTPNLYKCFIDPLLYTMLYLSLPQQEILLFTLLGHSRWCCHVTISVTL